MKTYEDLFFTSRLFEIEMLLEKPVKFGSPPFFEVRKEPIVLNLTAVLIFYKLNHFIFNVKEINATFKMREVNLIRFPI